VEILCIEPQNHGVKVLCVPRRWWCEASVINRCPPNIYTGNSYEIEPEIVVK
jgi:hypothetical protein